MGQGLGTPYQQGPGFQPSLLLYLEPNQGSRGKNQKVEGGQQRR